MSYSRARVNGHRSNGRRAAEHGATAPSAGVNRAPEHGSTGTGSRSIGNPITGRRARVTGRRATGQRGDGHGSRGDGQPDNEATGTRHGATATRTGQSAPPAHPAGTARGTLGKLPAAQRIRDLSGTPGQAFRGRNEATGVQYCHFGIYQANHHIVPERFADLPPISMAPC
jgi:hypothetical protein